MTEEIIQNNKLKERKKLPQKSLRVGETTLNPNVNWNVLSTFFYIFGCFDFFVFPLFVFLLLSSVTVLFFMSYLSCPVYSGNLVDDI